MGGRFSWMGLVGFDCGGETGECGNVEFEDEVIFGEFGQGEVIWFG